MSRRPSSALGVGSQLGDWVCSSQLGSGSFGIVHDSGQVVALKKCRFGQEVALSEKHCEQWRQEVDIMQRLDHPNVVQCFPTPDALRAGLQEEESRLPLLCMEFCNGGDLRKVLNRPENCCGLAQDDVLAVVADIAAALGFLHNRRIIHRDLKPENVVLQEPAEDGDGHERTRYKLIDLGYAKELGQSSLALSFVGTLQYIAPELFLSQTYSRSVDYWSLGFICHEVVTGQRPFLPNFSPGQWMDHVQNKTADEICIYQEQPSLEVKKRKDFFPENQLRRSLSKELSRWLRSLLKWDPAQRGKNNVGEVCIFNELGNVLSRPRVQVVSMDRGLHDLDSVVPDSWTGSQLAEFAERETGVPAATQLILTGDGGQVKPFDNVLERLEASDDDDHVVYVFNLVPLQQNVADRIKTVDLVMPASLSPLLQNPRAEVSYPHRKVIYSHAVAFARREQEVFQQRQDGAHALARHLQALLAAAQASEQQLAKGLDRILAKFELFQESLYHDQEKYREQARQKDHITSNRIFESWKAAERELKESLHKTRARVAAAAEQLKAAAEEAARAHKMSSTQREAAQKGQSGLQPFLSRAVAKYEGLKRIPVEGRKEKEQVMDVPQLVVKCLKQRYASFEQHFAWREQLMALHGRLQQLAAEQAALQQAMEQLITALSKLQRRRQSDVWKLVAAALQQKTDAGGGGGGGSVAGSRPGSASSLGASAGGGAAQQQGLTEMQKQQLAYLESTSERSRELVAENEALRMQMQELMIGAGMVSRSSTQ